MRKHVAAVRYGIGNRLDASRSCCFRLRGVDPAAELISAEMVLAAGRTPARAPLTPWPTTGSAPFDIEAIFDIELDADAGPDQDAGT